MSHPQAIVFDAPQALSVQTLELKPFEDGDLAFEVSHSGISTGAERLLWDGTMPPFPGLGYPLVQGCETVGTVVLAGPQAPVPVGVLVFMPGSCGFQGVRNIFGGAGSRLVVPHGRLVVVAPELGPKAVLLALAATCCHAIALEGAQTALVAPTSSSAMGR